MLRKVSVFALAVVIASGIAGSASAQSQPAAKVTAQAGSINILEQSGLGWTTILQGTIKTSAQKDLFVGVTMECGLLTRTLVKSKNAVSDTSGAQAGVKVRVLVDGQMSYPGEVTYCKRTQELTATFQGIIDGCLSVDPVTGGVILDEACVQPEELELLLDTMNANGYNYLMDNVGVGVHNIQVQARIDTDTWAQAGSSEALATIGKGSLTVEEVRLLQGQDIVIDF